jgi:hypothetical protein
VCSDQKDLLYRIDRLDAFCPEARCREEQRRSPQQMQSSNTAARRMGYPDFVPLDHFESTVVMLSGLPGAGTYTYVFHYYQDWPVIKLDAIRRDHKPRKTLRLSVMFSTRQLHGLAAHLRKDAGML